MKMCPARQGFTLIELLVVVLIIGILAAIALPQYKLATDKARFMKYIPLLLAVKRAQEAYYLENGKYTMDLTALDINYMNGCTSFGAPNNMWTCPDGFYIDNQAAFAQATGLLSISLCPEHNASYSTCKDPYRVAIYRIYFDNYSDKKIAGTVHCSGDTSYGKKLCKKLLNN